MSRLAVQADRGCPRSRTARWRWARSRWAVGGGRWAVAPDSRSWRVVTGRG